MSGLVTLQTHPVHFPASGYTPDPLTVRKASMRDVPALLAMINAYAQQGIMLPRTEFEMAENIRDFTVVHAGGRLVGCGALHFYSSQTAEVRSLAVDTAWKGHGAGRELMDALEDEARLHALKTIFAFTYVDRFFEKMGYRLVERGALPLKAWKDCLRCPKFQACDEIAMVKDLTAPSVA